MLQRRKKIIVTVVCLLCVLSISAIVSAAYISTNRDTRKAPEAAVSDLQITTAYQLLHSTDRFEYYFREDRDIIAIKELTTGYVWKTGIDSPFKKQVEDAKEAIESGDQSTIDRVANRNDWTVEQMQELANTPLESSMTATYIAMANSLVSIEYFEGTGDQMKKTNLSSAAEDEDEGTSAIQKVGSDTSEWVLKVTMEEIDLGFNVYITFGDDGSIKYDVPYDEIEGKGIDVLATIAITPFLGASGGEESHYNAETGKFDTVVSKYMTPGYVLVPDGSGSLIRFTQNTTDFTKYVGDVYGADPASELVYFDEVDKSVPLQNPVMPVFGISHGDGTQTAFVAYADEGDEYMQINVAPQSMEKNAVRYTYAYPRFVYNMEYFQVTTQAGATYRKPRDEAQKFDVSMTYSFLYGDGSNGEPKADYTGMAQAYREHLIETGELTVADFDYDEIPLRLDFLMSDSKKGVVGTTQVTMTTTDDVDNILSSVTEKGITNVNAGLIGWQKKGETLSRPDKAKYSGEIGREKDFSSLISKYAVDGIDISLSRDFVSINETMMNYYNNAAKHNNTQYLVSVKSAVLPENAPVKEFGYALPTKTVEWLNELYSDVKDFSNSLTITGMSDTLVSSHNSDGSEITVSQAIDMYQKAVEGIEKDGAKINMENPNAYFWKYVDRYLQTPVGSSQYVYETDTVPFLQMVLNGTMEMYAPYSNFSFYSQSDMLRMIDYNISPSFVLTQQPSYLLASTTSADYYSTEYDQYAELIQSIYNTVNEPLSQVIGYEWIGRIVLEEGVIVNNYSNGSSEKIIVINYTDEAYDYNGTRVDAESAKVIEGGIN